MSLNNVSRDIISKAEYEKQKISKELEALMSEKELESEERIKFFNLQLKEKFDLDTNSKLKIIKGKAIGDSKKIILDSKNKAIKKTYSDIFEELDNLNDKDRNTILKNFMQFAKLKIDYETIYCSKKDLSFIKSMAKNKIIKTKDINGLIFENKTKDEILNLTFDVMASDIFEKYEDKIQEILFE